MTIEQVILEALEPDEETADDPMTGWNIWSIFVGPECFDLSLEDASKINPKSTEYRKFRRELVTVASRALIQPDMESGRTWARRTWSITPKGQAKLENLRAEKEREQERKKLGQGESKILAGKWYGRDDPAVEKIFRAVREGKLQIQVRKPV